MSGAKALVLVDCESTLMAAREAGWLRDTTSTAVAVTKYGVQACAGARIPHMTVDGFYEFDELIARCLDTYERLGIFCDTVDARLWQWHDDLRDRIRPFRFAYYELKILVDTVSTKLFQLRRILARTDGIRVVYRKDPSGAGETTACDWTFPERRNLFGELLEATDAVGVAGVTLEPVVADPSTDVPPVGRPSLAVMARDKVRSLTRAAVRAGTGSADGEFILFSPGGHDVQHLLPALAARGLRVSTIPPIERPASTGGAFVETWRRLCGDESFRAFFSSEGISYFPVVRSRLQRLVTELTPAARDSYEQAASILARDPAPRFALTSSMTVPVEVRGQMHACQHAGLRVVTYQEGAGFGSVVHPMNDYAEVTEGDAFLCYGEGNVEYHDALAARGRPVKPFHVVGSAEQDSIRARARSRAMPAKVASVMYVSTTIAANRQHHPFNGSTDTVYAGVQLAVFAALDQIARRVTVRIKPHPADGFPRRYFAPGGQRAVEILDGLLEDHLDGTDLFIVDFPSTTLLTCCQAAAHIFVLADPRMTEFTDAQLRSLQKRAFVFRDVAALVDAVNRLEAADFRMPDIRTDDEYLRRYATYRGDGRSAERAAALLETWERK